MELLPSPFAVEKTVCGSPQGARRHRPMADFDLSAFAMFFMQAPPFLTESLTSPHYRINIMQLATTPSNSPLFRDETSRSNVYLVIEVRA